MRHPDPKGAHDVSPATDAAFEEIRHRLRGAAAMFALPELRDASKVLELAARLTRLDRREASTVVTPRVA